MTLYGLSLTQPWATMMAIGAKKIETRSWHPGPDMIACDFAIQAAKWFPDEAQDMCFDDPFFDLLLKAGLFRSGENPTDRLPLGKVVAIARLAAYTRIHSMLGQAEWYPPPGTVEYMLGDYTPGRWMWLFEDIRPLREPVPLRGRQMVFPISASDEAAIRANIAA